MAVARQDALALVKARLNRLPGDTSLDNYLGYRVDAAMEYLEGIGIHLSDSNDDLMLVVDMAVWQYQNRDNTGAMPEWLRLQRRERWIRTEAEDDDS